MLASEFTYRPILEELTLQVNDRGLDPFDAYAWLYEQEQSNGLTAEYYCSTAITSGGHARDPELDMRGIILRNTKSAAGIAEQLAADKAIAARSSIEPVFVGKTHWNQAEFMEFWLSVIGGYRLTPDFLIRDVDALRTASRSAADALDIDRELMTSKAPAESRALEYFKMSNAFASLIRGGAEARPIANVIRMIDTEKSLGAQTERTFARQIGSTVFNIGLVKPATTEDLRIVNGGLAEDTERLIRFGATVFDMDSQSARLILVEQDEAA